MGEKTITAKVKIDGDITPDFSYDWEVEFMGERYVHPSRRPQASKDNTSSSSSVDLTFKHKAIVELQRYYFVEMTSIESGTAIADKYNASLGLTLPDFIIALNNVLSYYYGGRIQAVLNPAWEGSDTPSFVEINYTYIWDVLQSIYDIYAVRWTLETGDEQDTYLIKFGYPSSEASHIFEYGYKGGLIKVERQVQSSDIRNIILGRGGDQNLPYLYFKDYEKYPTTGNSTNGEFRPDPDAVPELKDIYFSELRSAEFRSYVQGWAAKHHEGTVTREQAYVPSAWDKGYSDEKFDPIEYVKDEDSITKYGKQWGALENNDEIYPSIQGSGYDDVVAVEEILSDEIIDDDQSAESTHVQGLNKSLGTISKNSKIDFSADSRDSNIFFTIDPERTGVLTVTSSSVTGRFKSGEGIRVIFTSSGSYKESDGEIIISDNKIKVYEKDTNKEVNPSAIPSGEYYYVWSFSVENSFVEKDVLDCLASIANLSLITSDNSGKSNPNVFDIWVKNIWGTEKQGGETDEQYAERVWKPILGANGEEAQITFTTGLLAVSSDYQFTIVSTPVYDTSKSNGDAVSHWRITLAKSDAEYDATGLLIPNTKVNAKAGDLFFFTGIELPHQYVVWAEERLHEYKKDSLLSVAEIQPTWVVSIDKVRANQLEGDETQKIIDQLSVGASIRLRDKRFMTIGEGSPYVVLYVQSVTYSWREPSDNSLYLYPDIEIVLSDKVATVSNPVENLSNEVSSLRQQIGVGLSNMEQVVRKVGDRTYLRKDGLPDVEAGNITFYGDTEHRGVTLFRGDTIVGKEGFAGGVTGFGCKIDKYGNGEFESLIIRRFLEVPEYRYNRIDIQIGNKWRAPGGGIIESVVIDRDDSGNPMNTGTIYLHLEDGEVGTIAVDDICSGIYHDENNLSNNSTEDTDDSKGNFMFSGFATCYFRITEVFAEGGNASFRYSTRPVSSSWGLSNHPAAGMHFVSYGNFSDVTRQTSRYSTRTYERYLKDVNDWEFSVENIGAQFGDLSNLNVFGLNMTGYSAYLNNIYMTGVIKQFTPSGEEIPTINDRGVWDENETYHENDDVYHNNSKWRCVVESTTTEPSKDNPDWELLQEATKGDKGDPGIQGCIVRTSQWTVGVEYRNDESLTTEEELRFIDYVVVGDNDNFNIYKCLRTHTSSNTSTPSDNSEYWQRINTMYPIYTPTILADNAVFRFGQGNRILIVNDAGEVCGFFQSGENSLGIGSDDPSKCNFFVNSKGDLYASNANIKGNIQANSGSIADFTIQGKEIVGRDGTIVLQNDILSSLSALLSGEEDTYSIPIGSGATASAEKASDGQGNILTVDTITATTEVPLSDYTTHAGVLRFAVDFQVDTQLPEMGIIIGESPTATCEVLQVEASGQETVIDRFSLLEGRNNHLTFINSPASYRIRTSYGATFTVDWLERPEGETQFPILEVSASVSIVGYEGAENISYQANTPSTRIGTDGLFSFWSPQQYLYFSKDEGFSLRSGITLTSPNGEYSLTVNDQGISIKGEAGTDASNNTVSFTMAGTRVNISTGEKLSVAFGKIARWLADLKTVAFTGKYSDLDGRPASLPANGGNADTVDGKHASDFLPTSARGAVSGVASLDESGRVPAAQLPSYVDDVLEYATVSAFPAQGEAGKIYVATQTNLTYRWSGTGYVEISPSLALGGTSSTAFPGDRGVTLETKVSNILDGGLKVAKAASADTALEANHATTADTATQATNADYANSATNAEYAVHAQEADEATSADTASALLRPDNGKVEALWKDVGETIVELYAGEDKTVCVAEATHATTADTATRATQDGNGANIAQSYLRTMGDASNTTANFNPDDESSALEPVSGGTLWSTFGRIVRRLRDIVSGAVPVSKATSADSATQATQDGDGNNISSTYLKRSGGQMEGVLSLRMYSGTNPGGELSFFGNNEKDSNGALIYGITSFGSSTPVSIRGTWIQSYLGLHFVGNGKTLTINGDGVAAEKFIGNLQGNATNDGDGNEIADTYLSRRGGVMTGTLVQKKSNCSIHTDVASYRMPDNHTGWVRIDFGLMNTELLGVIDMIVYGKGGISIDFSGYTYVSSSNPTANNWYGPKYGIRGSLDAPMPIVRFAKDNTTGRRYIMIGGDGFAWGPYGFISLSKIILGSLGNTTGDLGISIEAVSGNYADLGLTNASVSNPSVNVEVERARKDGNGKDIPSTYATKEELPDVYVDTVPSNPKDGDILITTTD